MNRPEQLQQILDAAFNEATSNTVFANDRHQDIARTWFEEGYLMSEKKRKDQIEGTVLFIESK